jgi:hypothetical protein
MHITARTCLKFRIPCTFEFLISATPYLQPTTLGISLGGLGGKTPTIEASTIKKAVKYSEERKLATYLYLFGRVSHDEQLRDVWYSMYIQQYTLHSLQGFSSQQLLHRQSRWIFNFQVLKIKSFSLLQRLNPLGDPQVHDGGPGDSHFIQSLDSID